MMDRKTRTGRSLDSLMWLGLAGILAALLVPAPRKHVAANPAPKLADKRSALRVTPSAGQALNPNDSGGRESIGKTLPSPIHGGDDGGNDAQYFPSGHEFILQNEADFIAEQNQKSSTDKPAPPSGPVLAPPMPE